jgi:hypothetical protein
MDQYWRSWPLFMQGFMASTYGDWLQPTIVDLYLFSSTDSNTTIKVGRSISGDKYSKRMGHLLNAYLTCMNIMYSSIAGTDDDTLYFWYSNITNITNITCIPPKLDLSGDNLRGRNISRA